MLQPHQPLRERVRDSGERRASDCGGGRRGKSLRPPPISTPSNVRLGQLDRLLASEAGDMGSNPVLHTMSLTRL